MTSPDIIPLHDIHTLDHLRFNAQASHKAAVLPFYMEGDVPKVVVYAPVPQHEGEHGRILPYQIARGTIQALYLIEGKKTWLDKGRRHPPEGAEWVRDETPSDAAMREAEEEVGLPRSTIQMLYDCGKLPYQNPRGTVYGLHTFLARIPDASVLAFPDPYACAARLDGITLQEAQQLAELPDEKPTFEARPFKKSYLTLLEALYETVRVVGNR